MSSPHEHLEQAEHEAHLSLDGINRKAAFSIAIIAALLAAVSMLGHRSHNETLRLATEVGTLNVAASNEWAHYQAKRLRQHLDQNMIALIRFLPEQEKSRGIREAKLTELSTEVADYKSELDKISAGAKKLEDRVKETEKHAHEAHERANWLD